MNVEITPSKLHGTVRIPASKSVAHRMLICAALAEGTSVISGVDISRDITATMEVLTAFGAAFSQDGSTITVTGVGGRAAAKEAIADCCESGSTLRFLIPVAAALGIHTTFFGQGRLPQRPITAYLRELPPKGITFYYENTMPFTIEGHLQPGIYELEGDVSSQYVTGLLFALALLDGDSEIRMLSRLESRPYVDLTIDCLRRFGVEIKETENGYSIPGGQKLHPCDLAVEGDYSQAAFFYVANALGSDVELTNLNPDSVQGDKKIIEITSQMCYNLKEGKPACFTVDASDIPDLVPILAVLATFGTAPSRITGAHRLAIKESDRLAATADMLNRLGGKVTASADGLEIEPVQELHGGIVDSFGDHRIVMCAAVAATRCTGVVTILHGDCVEKSYPRFFEDYQQLGGIAHVIVLES
ncbi:MAG: 3-phosphoshikimate 1-carboxyvinyltransferase [Ruminococcus sp.]